MFKCLSAYKKRLIAILAAAAMVLSLLPMSGLQTISADEEVPAEAVELTVEEAEEAAADDGTGDPETKETTPKSEVEHTHNPGEPVKENETDTSYEEAVYCTECKELISRKTVYTKYTIVGWENDGPEGAIKSVKVNGEALPETGATLTAEPGSKITVDITLNDGFTYDPDKYPETFIRLGGVQSKGVNLTSSSYPNTTLQIPSSSWLNGEYGEENTDQEIYIIIPTKEKSYYKITVDTGGKADISLSNQGKERSDMVKIGENNTILIDKEIWDRDYSSWSIGGAVDFAVIPEVEGFHQGDITERSGLVMDDPDTLTDWESYDASRKGVRNTLVETVDENGCATVYVKWFEELNSMSIAAEAPQCGTEIGEEDVPSVSIPSGEVWEFAGSYADLIWINLVEEYGSWYYPWVVIEDNIGTYDSWFTGKVTGGNPYYIELHFNAPFGYYYNPEMPMENITVAYTDAFGNACTGIVRNTMILSSTAEMDYNIVMFEVEAQHVPDETVIENEIKPTCLEDGSHDEVIYCIHCEEELSRETVTDPALGHDWGKWIVTKEPAINVAGERQRTCKRCGLKETEPIPPLVGYTVTFDENGHGTAPDSQLILAGETAEEPEALTEEGFIFEGWYKDAEGSKAFDFSTAIKKDITVYAKWSEDDASYTVTFDANGHGTAPEAQSVLSGETAAEPEALTEEGFVFEGWYKDAEGSEKFDFSTKITEDITVYAKWSEEPDEEIIYTIVEGADSVWKKGSSTGVRIVVKRNIDDETCFSHYTGFLLDGNALSVSASAGSTVIMIDPAALEKIGLGNHNVTVTFDDGKAETTLTITEASIVPVTGDSSGFALWTALMIAALIVLSNLTVRKQYIK